MRIIVHPLLANGGHARYPATHRSADGDVVVNIVHLDVNDDPILDELEAIRRRLDEPLGSDERPAPRPRKPA